MQPIAAVSRNIQVLLWPYSSAIRSNFMCVEVELASLVGAGVRAVFVMALRSGGPDFPDQRVLS